MASRHDSAGTAPQPVPRSIAPTWQRAALWYLLIAAVLVVWLFPVYWIVVTSLKTRDQIINRVPLLVFEATSANYVRIFGELGYGSALVRSLLVAATTTFLSMVIGSLTAYALARLRFRGRDQLSQWFLSLRMMPAIVIVVPYFLLWKQLRLLDTYHGLVLVYLSFSLPFAIWLLQGFFAEVPLSLDEAAAADGCNRLQTLFLVFLPTVRPGLAVTALFVFVFAWNEYLLALMLAAGKFATVPVFLGKLINPYQILWGELAAGSVVALVPLLAVVFLLQRHIVRGLTLGAVR